jgi:hypothetical protein
LSAHKKNGYICFALTVILSLGRRFYHLLGPEMLDAKQLGKPILPILVHAAIHACLMGLVLWAFYGFKTALIGFAIQLLPHFFIDLFKGKVSEKFPVLQNPSNKLHWMVFGLDQQLHIVVIVMTAYIAAVE